MLTLLTAIGSIIFALLSVISFLFNKNKALGAQNQEQVVKDQLNALDAKILGNQAAIDQVKSQTAEKEKGETNESIINDLNNPPKP